MAPVAMTTAVIAPDVSTVQITVPESDRPCKISINIRQGATGV